MKSNIVQHLIIIFAVLIISIAIFSNWALGNNISNNSNYIDSNNKELNFLNFNNDSKKEIFEPKDMDSESCSSCHEDFVPFKVYPELIRNNEVESDFNFNVEVLNSDRDIPHEVIDLSAVLTGIEQKSSEPYNNQISGSIRRYQVVRESFNIDGLASEIRISLNGDSGILRRNNLDLFLFSPTGLSWSSTNSGVSEEIYIDMSGGLEGGSGDYFIEIEYISGVGAISYSLTINVNYISTELYKFGDDLNSGESYTFKWELVLTNEELNSLSSQISGTVQYEHDGGRVNSYRYTIEVTPESSSVRSYTKSSNSSLIYGRIFGTVSLFLLVGISITGFPSIAKKTIYKIKRIKNPQNFHCISSLIILIISLTHGLILLNGLYSINSTPSFIGMFAFSILGIITVMGFSNKVTIAWLGKRVWKYLHLALSIIIILIVFYHSFTFGTDFQFFTS